MSREEHRTGLSSPAIAPGEATRSRPRRARLRVALVIYRDSAGWGGAYRVGETLGAHLAARGVEPHLVFAYGEPGPVGRAADFACHYLRARGPGDLSGWRRARRCFRELRPDLIHFVEPIIWLNAALVGSGFPRLWYAHGRMLTDHTSRLSLLLLRLIDRAGQGCVCISEGARQNLLQLGLARPQACWVVRNAVEVDRFARLPGRAESRASLGIPPDVKLLGMVCRLIPDKGCGDALAVLSRLDPGWHLMLSGEGPYRGELERLAVEKNLRERVHFTGALADVRPAYAAMDAYLFLSSYEPFGLVLAEAMAAGVPVFGLGAQGEYREPEYPLVRTDNAVLVERRRPEQVGMEPPAVLDELAQRLLHFGDHPEKYRDMVTRARAWVRERFDAPRQAQAMAEIYARVAGSR